jgi:cytochrome P450
MMSAAAAAEPGHPLPQASLADTLGVLAEVVLPTLAKGVIMRRPKVMQLSERLDLNRRAVLRLRGLRERYGDGPLLLRIPLRNQAVILSPADVRRVLQETPHPFSAASAEKRAALAHLEPKASLVSEGSDRDERRRFNDEVLDSHRPVHRMAAPFLRVVEEEAAGMLGAARAAGTLSWDGFIRAWYALVRRVVFGDGARDDDELTDMLGGLRSAANWAFLRPRRTGLLERFHARVDGHLREAGQGSLAAVIAARPDQGSEAPSHQVAHWLFAFEPAGMATFRALALLAAHPDHAARARREAEERRGDGRADLPFLRACVLESLRLWPTTPAILRETVAETSWRSGTMPARTSVIIFAPFFHRDADALPVPDRFHPDRWLENPEAEGSSLVPFSGGPATCPARNLVPLLSAAMLACLLDGGHLSLKDPARLDPQRPMPGLLDNSTLAFALHD